MLNLSQQISNISLNFIAENLEVRIIFKRERERERERERALNIIKKNVIPLPPYIIRCGIIYCVV